MADAIFKLYAASCACLTQQSTTDRVPQKTDTYFLQALEGRKPGIKVPQGSVSGGLSFPTCRRHLLARSSRGLSPLCAHGPRARELFLSLLMTTLILSDQGPTLMISFNHKHFLTTTIVILGVRAPTRS